TASDADGDPLTFTVQYSPDNGATWQAVCTDYSSLEITLSTTLLPGGSQARLRVVASDGVNTALAVTGPFVIAKHPPQPAIDGVTEGQRLDFGSDVRLAGAALDAENGSKDNQLTWTLSGPTSLSRSGETLSLSRLSPGAYAATLSAIDLDY